jgi:glucans biosynthesis protein
MFYYCEMEKHNRRCTAVNKNGKACKAWTVFGSDPPRCSAHAGRNVGAGAPKGNTNALKHGLYRSQLTVEEEDLLDSYGGEKSLQNELAMARLQVSRLVGYQSREDVPIEQKAKMAPMIISGLRAIAYLARQTAEMEEGIDWDAVLDSVGEQLDWDI